MSHHSSNQLCVIEGDYKILENGETVAYTQLDELIENYRVRLKENDFDDFSLIHSKDGSELYNNLLQSFGLTSSDLDATFNSLNQTRSNMSMNNLNYVCFLINDFDQNDKTFLKLEETQSKLSSLFNALNSTESTSILQTTTSLASLKNVANQRRFMIFGWPVLKYCYQNNLSLINALDVERPLYCKLMSGCFVCFTGFRKDNKNTVANCIKLVHYMGGSVRKEYNKKITHLIVKSTLSTKYKTAYNIGRCHLLTEEWIVEAWKYRDDVKFDVNNEEFIKNFKLKALYSLSIAFYGFTPEETQHMKEVTIENGGSPISDFDDPMCTHIVINDQEVKHLPNGMDDFNTTPNSKQNAQIPFNSNLFANTRASIVKAEWFWASIQICCRASECLYEFTKPKTEVANKPDPPTKRIKLSMDNLLSNDLVDSANAAGAHHLDSPHLRNTPTSAANNLSLNKLNSSNNPVNNVLQTTVNDCDSPTINNINNRLSTGGDRFHNRNNMSNNNLSTSASLLDATTDDAMSIDSPFEKRNEHILNSASSNGANSKKINKRSQRIFELYETEKRFVNILHTIIVYFKDPIEAPDQAAGPILDQTEIKEIFGNLPPIYEVHCKIKDRLEKLTNRLNVNEESISVGDIYLDNADALLKTYPPFVNFYEKTKDAILNCDKIKPRFHAFLKIAQSKPECGRQTLVELLIRPVQRLPSTLLLLDDILKETPKSHRDFELLTKAIASLKEVMTHINEDKRKIENQLAMFVLINDIENCPATLLSSHRSFLKKIDVYETSNELLKKGAQLTLFLFTDCLEICKPRLKLINAAKSPNNISKQRTPQKCYKHIALFSLNNVTKVCDILQNNDDTDLFGILCRLAGEKDKFYSFKVLATSAVNSTSINQSTLSSACSNNQIYTSTTNFSTLSSTSSASSYNSSLYASTTNLNAFDEHNQAINEKKEYIKLLAQGICNVKCITEYSSSSSFLNNSSSYYSAENFSINKTSSHQEQTSSESSTSFFSSFSSSSSSSNTSSSLTFCLFDEFNSNIKQIESALEDDCEQMQFKSIDRLVRQHFDLFSKATDTTPKRPQASKSPVYYFSEPTNKKRTRVPIYKKRTTSLQGRLVRTKSYYYHQIHRKRRHLAYDYNCQMKLFELKQRILINRLKKKENILCTIEAKQLQIDLNESGGSKKLDAVKSYAKIINRRVSRAFSFSQDTPNKIKKTISSVFRSPFQSYSQQSLNDQKASKLTSLASLQLTPTLMETKRRFTTLQKSRDNFFKQQTNINTQTTSSLLSLDNCGVYDELLTSSSKISTLYERSLSRTDDENEPPQLIQPPQPVLDSVYQTTASVKRQYT